MLDYKYLSVRTNSLFVRGARGPKIKTGILGYWLQLFCLPKACLDYFNTGYHIL